MGADPKNVGNEKFFSSMRLKRKRAVFDGFYGIEYPCDWNWWDRKVGLFPGACYEKDHRTVDGVGSGKQNDRKGK